MPVFDRSASRPSHAEADFLRSVLGPAKPQSTSFQLSRDYRRRQRRASLARALIVLVLLGFFCASAIVMSETPRLSAGAAPVHPAAAAQVPFRADALKTGSGTGEAIAPKRPASAIFRFWSTT
jgi:hypothetical protein